jgi:hypothetical protein
MCPWSPLHAPRRTCLAVLIAAHAVSSCGGGPFENARALSEADCPIVDKPDCVNETTAP